MPDSKSNNFSPRDLLTTTISDEIALNNNHQSKIHSLAFDGRASVLAGGHAADGAWWFDVYTGNWTSSNYYCDSLPAWLNEFNEKKLPELYVKREWTPQLQVEDYSAGKSKTKNSLNSKNWFLTTCSKKNNTKL